MKCLALARLGGFLHLPLFRHDCDVEQAERQNHHHEDDRHVSNVTASIHIAKITEVPAG